MCSTAIEADLGDHKAASIVLPFKKTVQAQRQPKTKSSPSHTSGFRKTVLGQLFEVSNIRQLYQLTECKHPGSIGL
jgi:hypothetical protein